MSPQSERGGVAQVRDVLDVAKAVVGDPERAAIDDQFDGVAAGKWLPRRYARQVVNEPAVDLYDIDGFVGVDDVAVREPVRSQTMRGDDERAKRMSISHRRGIEPRGPLNRLQS